MACYYWHMEYEIDPKTGERRVKQQQPAQQHDAPISASDWATIETMSREGLIKLIRTVVGAGWGKVGGTGAHLVTTFLRTPEEILEATKLKLATGGLIEADMFKALPLLREWMDRQTGKPAQSIAMTVKQDDLSKMSTERLLALEKEMARLNGVEALVIAPMPEKLPD